LTWFTILGRAGLADLRRMVEAKIGQPLARWPAGYPFDCWRLYRLRRPGSSGYPNIYQPLQAVEVFAVAHSFTETCGFAA